ncbi:hypothetical protein CDAR_411341 [Caerostris darwini]|uniref:Uncharacterized protein n=1 Tax=Caerostris darwini TaxID=1538125 RepID=A0AAV4SFS2_9ARAC|nr:hypothetical protein CDAR_411341 [Caerostris darwini]
MYTLSLIIKERAQLLWAKITKTSRLYSLGDHVSTETERNLKIQRGFAQRVADLIFHFIIDFGAQQFLLPCNPIEAQTFSLRLGFSQSVLKTEDNDKVLKSVTYETIDTLYPISHWLRVSTDGSRSSDCANFGTGVHCELFSFYFSVGATV